MHVHGFGVFLFGSVRM